MKKKLLAFILAFTIIGIGVLNPLMGSAATKAIAVTSLKLSTSSVTLTQGVTFQLKVTITPSNATNKTINWSSSNTSIATINSNGKLTAKKTGSCTITAKSNNNKTTKCSVKVNAAPVTIKAINSVAVTTTAGTAPILPSIVTTHMSDGTTKSFNVTWSYIDPSKYANAGTFGVNGLVSGTLINATAVITVIESQGNTPGNIVNAGIAAQQDCWTYFQGTDNCIYKMKTDGTETTKVNNDVSSNINIVGDWIYYVNDGDNNNLYKIKTDSTGRTKLSNDNCDNINVVGNSIYYDIGNGSGLYKINTDGTGRTELCNDECYRINVVNGWIYYRNISYNNGLYKIKTDGTGRIELCDDDCYTLNVSGDWIYYDLGNDSGLYKIKTDGTSKTEICNDECYRINVVGNLIYYDIYNGNGLYKINSDGTGKTEISSDECNWIDVVGNSIYYGVITDSDGDWVTYNIQTDGTDRYKVNTSSATMTDSQFEQYLNNNYGSLTLNGETITFNWGLSSDTEYGFDKLIASTMNNSSYSIWYDWIQSNDSSEISTYLNTIYTAIKNNYSNMTFCGGVIYDGVSTSNPSAYFPSDEITYNSSTGTWSISHVSAYFDDSKGVTVYAY